jgi:hypothetical protein
MNKYLSTIFIVFILIRNGYVLKITSPTKRNDITSKNPNEFCHFPTLGLTVDAKNLEFDEFKNRFDGKYPVTLRNLLDFDKDLWCEKLLTKLGNEIIEYNAYQMSSSDRIVKSYETSLREFIHSIPDNSDHYGKRTNPQSTRLITVSFPRLDYIYLMDEIILQKHSPLCDVFEPFKTDFYIKDLYDFFPEPIRPKLALIVGEIIHC